MEPDRQVRWSQVTNIFDEAHSLGLNTALAGWFHPYSRVLGRALNVCEWRSSAIYEHARAATFGRALQNQIFSMFPILNQRSVSVERYRFLMARSTKLVTDPKYGLVFLHLPVPHKPALYRPESGRLTMFGRPFPDGYFDNLQLADRALGELRQAMEQAGAWDTSWVVVSADHWWRESRKYDGQLDYRVPFILKAPGQNACLPYEPSFNTVFTGELVTAILRQEIRTADEAAAWLDQHAHPVKTAYERSSAGE